jgi:hypothetical protein
LLKWVLVGHTLNNTLILNFSPPPMLRYIVAMIDHDPSQVRKIWCLHAFIAISYYQHGCLYQPAPGCGDMTSVNQGYRTHLICGQQMLRT